MQQVKKTQSINYVRLHTFRNQEQVAIMRAKLESEQILTRIENEHINRFYQEAIGEVHLLVPNLDVIRARKILEDAGIEVLKTPELSPWLKRFDEYTKRISLLSQFELEKRLVISGGTFGLLLVLFFLLIAMFLQ